MWGEELKNENVIFLLASNEEPDQIEKFAKKHKMIDQNPMDDVDSIKKESSRKNPLNRDEIKIFLEAVPVYYKPLFMFLFFRNHIRCFQCNNQI